MELREARPRLSALVQAIDDPINLTPTQFAQLFAFSLEYRPDLILELGRGNGNSTALFTEAANRLPNCLVASVCNTLFWQERSVPRLSGIVSEEWYRPLSALHTDLCDLNYPELLAGARRVLIFWDAHGFEVAECVLGRILPEVAERDHIVVMHDISDTRYCGTPPAGERYALWKGDYMDEGLFRMGGVASKVPQAISILDFAFRNRLTFESADHSIATSFGRDPEKTRWMRTELTDFYSEQAWWYWFTLNEHAGPYSFPKVPAPETGLE